MTKLELIEKLKQIEIKYGDDWEVVHGRQDDALLEYIDDEEVKEIFYRTAKWCA